MHFPSSLGTVLNFRKRRKRKGRTWREEREGTMTKMAKTKTATPNNSSRLRPREKKRASTKTDSEDTPSPARVESPTSADLRGWPAIAEFLGMPQSTAQRWGKDGMPIFHEGRKVVANREALNQWLQRSSGEQVGVHIATQDSNLLKAMQASLLTRTSSKSK